MKAIWNKSDYPQEKNGLKVYSCFACGGGSTMGYKLAGYEVIGANDIDKEMAKIYQENHNPKYYHLMDIRSLVQEENLPEEMFNLDILDGSPPCSTFSMSGNREEDWGKSKKFREGQAEQTLDTLFFDFIDLAKRLQPKIVIAENVKGMIQGNATRYVIAVQEAFTNAGYDTQLFLLNSSSMGVPQARERVFFIARRKDLELPKLVLNFTERPIFFGDIRTDKGIMQEIKQGLKSYDIWERRKQSDLGFDSTIRRVRNIKENKHFNTRYISDDRIHPTIVSGSAFALMDKPFYVSSNDLISVQTFPQDYNFTKDSYNFIKYVLGMSVPPVMCAKLAQQVELQLLSKFKK